MNAVYMTRKNKNGSGYHAVVAIVSNDGESVYSNHFAGTAGSRYLARKLAVQKAKDMYHAGAWSLAE